MNPHPRRTRDRLAPVLLALWSWAFLTHSAFSQGTHADEREKIAQTTATMKRLEAALFGTRDGAGYIGDMGRLPASLEELAAPGGSPGYSTNHAGSVGMGFNGPYLTRAGVASSAFVDAWNTPLALVTGSGDVRIRSAGPDRDPTTDADNVYYPLAPRTTHGTIEAIVTSVPEDGGSATPLDDGAVEVRVYYAADGAERSALATYTGSNGTFQLQNVHVGRHHVVVSARTPQDFAMASRADTATLRGKKASLRLQLVSKGPAEEPSEDQDEERQEEQSEVTLCHRPGGGEGQTLEVATPAVAAHLAHGDALGACTETPDEDEEDGASTKNKKK